MSAADDLIRRYASAWRRHDREGWLDTFTGDATQEDPIGSPVRHGRDEIAGFWDDAMAGYRSVAITPLRIFVVGDDATMYWRVAAELDEGWRVFDGVDVFVLAGDPPLITSVRAYWESDRRRVVSRGDVVHHLAIDVDWESALAVGVYRMSTVGRTLDDEGFIHCSYADQVEPTRDAFYRGRDDVVLLTIDPAFVPSAIKVEGGFPHIYGPLPVEAVISTRSS